MIILIMILCTFCTSLAQYYFKIGTLYTYHLYLGLFLYVIGAVLLMIALRKNNLSTTYPILATSYIWVALLAYYLGEQISIFQIIGITTIIIGVIFINLKSKIKEVPL